MVTCEVGFREGGNKVEVTLLGRCKEVIKTRIAPAKYFLLPEDVKHCWKHTYGTEVRTGQQRALQYNIVESYIRNMFRVHGADYSRHSMYKACRDEEAGRGLLQINLQTDNQRFSGYKYEGKKGGWHYRLLRFIGYMFSCFRFHMFHEFWYDCIFFVRVQTASINKISRTIFYFNRL